MVNFKFSNINVFVVTLLVTLRVANATEPISFEDFTQCFEDAVTNAMGNEVHISKLPPEVMYFIVDLYEDDILNDYETATKDDLTKILTKDIESRTKYYETNKKIFEAFVLTVLDKYRNPDEDSNVNVKETSFLSSMIMDTVHQAMKDIIASEKAPVDGSWKILNLKDAFRTVYFYCKYPKQMAPFLTEKMRVEVRGWLDSTATRTKWGFDDDVSGDSVNENVMKSEL